jgi:hypothetical protein
MPTELGTLLALERVAHNDIAPANCGRCGVGQRIQYQVEYLGLV